MIRWIKRLVRRVVCWALNRDLRRLQQDVREGWQAAGAAQKEVGKLRQQLSAVQAIDVDLHGGGKAIILTRVNGNDRCKIVEIAADFTVEQYRHLVQQLESTYGASPVWLDAPVSVPREFFIVDGKGR